MKKKRVLPRVVMAASVAAMGVGVFQTFDAEAMTTGAGYYMEPDWCGAYYPGCMELVIKCRPSGYDPCDAGQQVPCGEVCEMP
ncbi:hypothetical protein DN752_14465 [Echinicola strongylocentroti]|uniref:Membrane or secreted protein n=1 Tax=Echinicola strongylocentroti TaxID=1795355 RepID=A0A2Z4IKY9_9BACT|nr:hypothetical protein [Echinicola strongylocentroti]AWW31228.1 hypothetical protein DN752_14465 [Echinicola strongylocentroti]